MNDDARDSSASRGSGWVAIVVWVAFLASPSLGANAERMDTLKRTGRMALDCVEDEEYLVMRTPVFGVNVPTKQADETRQLRDEVAALRKELAELRAELTKMRKRK